MSEVKYINLGLLFKVEYGYMNGPNVLIAEHILLNQYEVKRLIEKEAKKIARNDKNKWLGKTK